MHHKPLAVLEQAVADFVRIDIQKEKPVENYNTVVGLLHRLVSAILQCEQDGIDKEKILAIIAPAKAFHSDSPFIHRCQSWPRGFPGDYETIEYLYHAKNHATPDTLGYYCEEYALLCPSTQQHRNKLLYQARLILDRLRHADGPVRVLSLASGSSLDIQWIQSALKGAPIEFVLNDTEQEALDVAKEKLSSIQEQCQFISGNVVEFLAWEAEDLGTFDLILTGGLFDYLEEKHVHFVLKYAHNDLLKPGGIFFFTNIAKDNPYRAWMEYLADWVLLERDEEKLMQIISGSKFSSEQVSIERDQTRLTCLVQIKQPEQA